MVVNKKTQIYDISDSEGVIAFLFYRYAYFDAYTWWRFELTIQNNTIINFEMDTGEILLRQSDLPESQLPRLTQAFRNILTPHNFNKDNGEAILPVLRLFPNGKYAVKLKRIGQPYLTTPDRAIQSSYVDDKYFYDFNDIRMGTTTPNILFPTIDISRCDKSVVAKFAEVIQNKPKDDWPLPVLFCEPTKYSELHRRYHPKGQEKDRQTPPDFGFNGNHIFFSGHNYYILDGHHKTLAYQKLGIQPLAISIECLKLADYTYPQRPWWKFWLG